MEMWTFLGHSLETWQYTHVILVSTLPLKMDLVLVLVNLSLESARRMRSGLVLSQCVNVREILHACIKIGFTG